MKNTIDLVLNRGLCVGCGACATACPLNAIRMESGEPKLVSECNECQFCIKVCPGWEVPMSKLYPLVFGREYVRDFFDLTGNFQFSFLAHSTDPDILKAGAAGGAVTGLATYALDSGIVEGVIVGGYDEREPWKTKSIIATTREQLIKGASSKHQVCSNVVAVRTAIHDMGLEKIGFVGVPCQIHAIRKMQLYKAVLGIADVVDRIEFTISIFCGSNFELEGTEFIINHILKISLDDVKRVSHREGFPKPGDFVVETKGGEYKTLSWNSMDYILGFRFMRDRCRVCPDQSGELSDISVGDVRPPIASPDRWSAVFVRTEKGKNIFNAAVEAGYLVKTSLDPERYYGQVIPIRGSYGKKYANWLRIKKRKKYGWPVPKIS